MVCIAGVLALIVVNIAGVSFFIFYKKPKMQNAQSTQDIQAVQDFTVLEEDQSTGEVYRRKDIFLPK